MRILKWEPNFSPIARVFYCSSLELDVSKPLVDSIFVFFEEDETKSMLEGFRVQVFYDVLPTYCTSCKHLGHGLVDCKLSSVVTQEQSRQCVAEANNAVYGDKVFDKRSQSVIPVAEVFVKLPDPTLSKHAAPSSADYSTNHRKEVAHSPVWNPINSTGAHNTLEENTSKQGNSDTSLHKVDGKIDASILKADLSNLDQGPALSNPGMMHTVIEEDEQGLELSSAGQITETTIDADCEANRGTFSSDLARVVGRVEEHCEEVSRTTLLEPHTGIEEGVSSDCIIAESVLTPRVTAARQPSSVETKVSTWADSVDEEEQQAEEKFYELVARQKCNEGLPLKHKAIAKSDKTQKITRIDTEAKKSMDTVDKGKISRTEQQGCKKRHISKDDSYVKQIMSGKHSNKHGNSHTDLPLDVDFMFPNDEGIESGINYYHKAGYRLLTRRSLSP
ncbi:hypothetical protein LIER_33366 [Lithospermum erythrorhizon]|uniref:DUF4283 domain-containing protein n=1 Tax=Lithospermum erythrorhizon TaxID=34254 RepID=A0AAV3RWL5_LITER